MDNSINNKNKSGIIIKKIIEEQCDIINSIVLYTTNYLKPSIDNMKKKYTDIYENYILVINNLTANNKKIIAAINSDVGISTIIDIFDIFALIEKDVYSVVQIINNGNLINNIIIDMSETFVNNVYSDKNKILTLCGDFQKNVNNRELWDKITNMFPDIEQDIESFMKNEYLNKFTIYIIKQNIDKLSPEDKNKLLSRVEEKKNKILNVESSPQMISNEFIINKIIRNYNLTTTESKKLSEILGEKYGGSRYTTDNTPINIPAVFDKINTPYLIISKNTTTPLDFSFNKILYKTVTPNIGISENIINMYNTIKHITPNIIKNDMYANKSLQGLFAQSNTIHNTTTVIRILETLNGIEFREYKNGKSLDIPLNIGYHIYHCVEMRTSRYNELMENVIISRGYTERNKILVREYELSRKTLANLDFIRNNIMKDCVDLFIDRYNTSEPRGEKSVKNLFNDIVQKNMSMIVYNNIITNIYTEDKTSESNITFLTKINTIIVKFYRKFAANLDNVQIANNIFDSNFKETRYSLVGIFRDVLWSTLKEIDSGNGLLKNIELSLKEYYLLNLDAYQ